MPTEIGELEHLAYLNLALNNLAGMQHGARCQLSLIITHSATPSDRC